ncbi:cysteine hydrolase family protein [Glycomyces sp. NPDC048151]|uniref:cysteine hydrolase family protein n=1 Tax=Glycomyces sp. NPDC048151 TaxID=3364002 RepID=UPI003713E44C
MEGHVQGLDAAGLQERAGLHDPQVAEGASRALREARSAGLPVFPVVHEAMRERLHPAAAPLGDEPALGKPRLGAFAGTDLHARLQQGGIGRVLIAGVATSGTVLSTARWAYDAGYEVAVCADACADPDAQVNAALLDESVHPDSWLGLWRIARVVDSAGIAGLLG